MSKQVKLLDKYSAEVLEERYNGLVERIEVKIRLLHLGEGTPSRRTIENGNSKTIQ